MKIAFVAVNYNNSMITVNYVLNILSMKNSDTYLTEIIIVDNFSEIDDYNYLRDNLSELSKVTLIRADKNIGYFRGLNFGLKKLGANNFDYVIVGNNDLFFERSFADKLAVRDYKLNQLVIVPDLVTLDGIHQNPQFINKPSQLRRKAWEVYYTSYFFAVIIDCLYGTFRTLRRINKKIKVISECEIFWCTGACMILRPMFFEKCGFLDDTTFLWGEEAFLAHQIEESSGKILYDPDLIVMHFENASVRKISSRKKYRMFGEAFKLYKNFL